MFEVVMKKKIMSEYLIKSGASLAVLYSSVPQKVIPDILVKSQQKV